MLAKKADVPVHNAQTLKHAHSVSKASVCEGNGVSQFECGAIPYPALGEGGRFGHSIVGRKGGARSLFYRTPVFMLPVLRCFRKP
jgi:hypothetical protein